MRLLNQPVQPFEPCFLHPPGCTNSYARDKIKCAPDIHHDVNVETMEISLHPELLFRYFIGDQQNVHSGFVDDGAGLLVVTGIG